METDKYFLCFGFENFAACNLKPFHVTLIYFGELTDEEVSQVTQLTTDFVTDDNFRYIAQQSIPFYHEAWFGKHNNIRVLLPDPTNHVTQILKNDVNDLLQKIKHFRKNHDFDFNPHLTTDLDYFSGRIDMLYLCKNNYEVVQEWALLT